MEKTIPSHQVKVGMFVAHLDRPWVGTPFLLQGFLVEDESQIARLQQVCKHVVIDPARSVGEHYVPGEFVDFAELGGPPIYGRGSGAKTGGSGAAPSASASSGGVFNVGASGDGKAQREGENFLKIAREFHGKIHTRRLPHAPRIHPETGQSRLTSELVYSAPIVDDVLQTLHSVQKAIAKGVAIDAKRVETLVDDMAESVERNPDAMIWLTRLKRTDQYGYDHALNVSVHLMILARFAGLDKQQVRRLGTAGLLQDIGKLRLDQRILKRPGPLEDHEMDHAREHVNHSVAILRKQKNVDPELVHIVECHHERFDGSGYPQGLREAAITLGAEMAGLVDTYCALTQDRAYSKGISSQKAMEQLNQMRNKAFRDALVDLFLQCIGLYPVGTLVELNSGEVGIVIQQNQVRRLQPKVLVLLAPDKSLDKFPRLLDLLMQPTTAAGELYRIAKALPPDSYGIDPREFYLA